MLLVKLNENFQLTLFILRLRDSDSGEIVNANLIRFGNQTLVYNKYMMVILPMTGVCYEAGYFRTTGNGGTALTPQNIKIAKNVMNSYNCVPLKKSKIVPVQKCVPVHKSTIVPAQGLCIGTHLCSGTIFLTVQ